MNKTTIELVEGSSIPQGGCTELPGGCSTCARALIATKASEGSISSTVIGDYVVSAIGGPSEGGDEQVNGLRVVRLCDGERMLPTTVEDRLWTISTYDLGAVSIRTVEWCEVDGLIRIDVLVDGRRVTPSRDRSATHGDGRTIETFSSGLPMKVDYRYWDSDDDEVLPFETAISAVEYVTFGLDGVAG